jgi:glucose-6-phosphate 1-dehydrogenase
MAARSENIAAKDIVRRNHLGQNVMVVAKGQPIPDHIKDVTDEERGVKKQSQRFENKAESGRPTPKAARK